MPEMGPGAGWRKVRFGEVIRQVKDIVDPETSGLERYVAGEHMDSDDLHVRRWGTIGDGYLGPAFHMRFRPGQVLYGSRRTYLRKVAVPDFEGVCANTTFVLESRDPEVLLPEMVPFLMQTDAFNAHSIEQSRGSVNPYVNFSDLEWWEFALPPLGKQRQLADLFMASANADDALVDALHDGERAFSSILRHVFLHGLNDGAPDRTGRLSYCSKWRAVPMASVAQVERGRFTHRPRNLPEFYGGPFPFVQTGDIASSRGDLRAASQRLSHAGVQFSRSFPPGTILITIAAIIGATAITVEETWCPDSLVGIVPSDLIEVRFLEYALRHARPYLEFEVATQTAQKNINLQVLRPLPVPLPSAREQREVVEVLGKAETAVTSIENRIRESRTSFLAMRNAVFRGP